MLSTKPPMPISIHALREEGDEFPYLHVLQILDFYPRPPRGGRQKPKQCFIVQHCISIHALHEEGDLC